MTDNELLLALSDMLDKKLDGRMAPMESRLDDLRQGMHNINLFQENIMLPRLDNIESCYTDTYKRYKNYADKMQSAFEDIELLKKVVTEHSEMLQKIS